MLTVYGDESFDFGEKKVFAVAGVIGTQEEWDELEPIWLAKNNGRIFHAADCESSRGAYKNNSQSENHQLYRELVEILKYTKLMGYGVTIDLKAYKEIFHGHVVNAPYFRCFAPVISYFANMGYMHIPQQNVKFNFHINAKTQYTAGELYDYMCNLSEWEHSIYLAKSLSFSPMDVVGIQVADMFAREIMKCVDSYYFVKKHDLRKSLRVLFDTGRFAFMHLDRNYLEYQKNISDELNKKSGITREKYAKWLITNKLLSDNATNRTRFLVYCELEKSK